MTVLPMTFEEWWKEQGGDNGMSDRLKCAATCHPGGIKAYFQECFLTGVALGLKELLNKGEAKP